MKKIFVNVILAFICSAASADDTGDMMKQAAGLFKQVENSIIDQLRADDPTLDSRTVKFTYGDYPGIIFADCCFIHKEITASSSSTQKELGKYLVTIGNENYLEFNKGIMSISIVPTNVETASSSSMCDFNASEIAQKLFGDGAAAIGKNPDFASAYLYQVMKNNKKVGEFTHSSASWEA